MLEDQSCFRDWYERMTPGRRAKIDAFRFREDKQRSLAAGIALSEGLKRAGVWQGIWEPAAGIALSEGLKRAGVRQGMREPAAGQDGKPYLPGTGVYYNLSHSGNYAVCAVSDREVGVDIEQPRHFSDSLRKYICAPGEELPVQITEETDLFFTRIWTIKESIMKYYGTGLALHPSQICILPGDPVKARLQTDETNETDDACSYCAEKCRESADRCPRGIVRPSELFFSEYRLGDCFVTVCSPCRDFTEAVEILSGEEKTGLQSGRCR